MSDTLPGPRAFHSIMQESDKQSKVLSGGGGDTGEMSKFGTCLRM